MSQKLLTKAAVLEKRIALTKDGKPPPLRALRSALGCGSMSTLVKIVGEIEREHEQSPTPDSETLTQFRSVWNAAKTAGREERNQEIATLQDATDALTAEVEILEGELDAARTLATQIGEKRDALLIDLADAQQRVTTARAAAEDYAGKTLAAVEQIAALREDHGREIASLNEKLQKVQSEYEESSSRLTSQITDLTRALAQAETKLAVAATQAAHESELRAAAVNKLAETEAELANARQKAETAMERVTEAQKDGMARLTAQQAQHAAEIAALIATIPSSGTRNIRRSSE